MRKLAAGHPAVDGTIAMKPSDTGAQASDGGPAGSRSPAGAAGRRSTSTR